MQQNAARWPGSIAIRDMISLSRVNQKKKLNLEMKETGGVGPEPRRLVEHYRSHSFFPAANGTHSD